ncbi:aromatic ring-hydroxylating dioxygenase subunit alpha [Polyangium fumosum]|nr:aromatic ring-hydroxylating dioxygenase subunit alpha [Polyangium fumosum]
MTKQPMRVWPAEGASRAPYWIYDDPEVFRVEQERIFGQSWCYVGLAAEVPEPGRFQRSHVGDRSVILVRDKEGKINVLENRCAHRGMEFCRASAGKATRFLCPYHQWTFDLEGNLCGVPFKRGIHGEGGMPDDFDLADHPLRKLRVTNHNGAVFASYAEEPEPFERYLADPMRAYFDRVFDGRPLRVLGYMRQRIPCNWKLILENTKDPYHATLLHSFLVTFGLFRADQKSEVRLDPSGRHAALVSRHGGRQLTVAASEMASYKSDYTLQDRRLLDMQAEFHDGVGVVMMTLFPNLILHQQGNSLATRHIVPRGPDSTELSWTFFGYEDDDEALSTRRLRQANLFGPAGLVSLDDGEALKATQEGLRNARDACAVVEMGGRDREDANVMVTETALRAFFHHYMHVMGFVRAEDER